MFSPVSSRVSFPELDARILEHWKERDVFRRAGTEREGAPTFMLYDGPPTANGSPGIHHVLARIFKDVMCRYKTMKGYQVLRKGGWDTHGLPVELAVEQELGLASKRDIEEYGIEEFNRKCRESVFRYVREWEEMTDRIGFWVDMDDPYVTLENDYIESGWWILKTLWDRGLLYQGMRGTPHCPRCVTSLSSHELALGYQEDTPDPSVFVKFRVDLDSENRHDIESWRNRDRDLRIRGSNQELPVYLLAWTTTPWTLPGNTALAVDADAEYSVVELEGDNGPELLILASALVEDNIRQEHTVVATLPGSELVGFGYTPLYSPGKFGSRISRFESGVLTTVEEGGYSTKVVAADFVSMEDGTGIVHIAPAFGDEDLGLGREKRAELRAARRLAGHHHGRLSLCWQVRQGRRPGNHGRPQRARPVASPRHLPPHLPVLLALRHSAALLRQEFLVHPHVGAKRRLGGNQQPHQLVSRPHPGGAFRRVAAQQRGLGHLPRALLGHAHPHLAVRQLQQPGLRRRAGRTQGTPGTPPP